MTTHHHYKGFPTSFALALMLSLAQSIHAATINVTANAVDTAVNGNCSLIEAIQAADTDAVVDACTAGSGADTINVPAGTYTLTAINNAGNGLPLATTTITIVGAGAPTTIITRSGATLFRFFTVASTGNLTLNGVTLSNGDSTTGGNDGGAIFSSGTLTVLNSTFSGNVSNAGGSALFNRGQFGGPGGILNLTSSTLSGNTGSPALETCCIGTTTVTNSTVSGNSAGGIMNRSGSLIVSYSTIASNTGTGIIQDDTTIAATLNNTIIANNTTNCTGNGAFTNGGNNRQFPGTTCGVGITTADPLLGPLANNGGPTQTMALLTGSPAIDAGNNALCPVTDQRGTARPQGPTCDIGAFELSAAAPPSNVPTLSPSMLGLLAIALAGVGFLAMRRNP